jgi:2'-5' RNA ligase
MSPRATDPGSLRLFVGLPLSAVCRARARRLRPQFGARLPGAFRWVRPENHHLTLRFLGKTPTDRMEDLLNQLGQVSFAPFRLRFGGGGAFPGLKRPSVLWVGLARGREESVRLAAAVNEAVARADCENRTDRANIDERNSREFVPHLTIGRVKRGRGSDKAKAPWEDIVGELAAFQWPEMVVDRFVLWRSVLRPEGPEYVPLVEFAACGRGAWKGDR